MKDDKSKYVCPVCYSDVPGFNRLPDYYHVELDKNIFIFSIFQFDTINWLQYSCCICGARDRDRLYTLYFIGETLQNTQEFKFLDITPSKTLQQFIGFNYPHIGYRSADLMMEDVDDKINVTQMDIYEDNTFDFFVCSHVLEHIKDNRKAMSESYRILKPGGKGIATYC